MRLEFEYSPEDLREAMAIAQLASMRQPRRVRYFIGIMSAVGAFGYAEILSLFVASHSQSKTLIFVILPLIPVALILTISALSLYFQTSGKTTKPWDAPARKSSTATSRVRRWSRFVFWAMLLAYACALPLLIERISDGGNDQIFNDGIFAAIAVACVFGFWALTTNQLRARAQGAWGSNKHLHGRFRFDIDDQYLLISGTQSSNRLRWTVFQGFTETPNLIILYLSPAVFHMVQKRAIASPADLAELSRILVQYVQHGHLFPRPSAFPVSPIPAIPVETVQGTQD